MSQKIDRTGEVSYTKYGTKATIIKYENNKNVLIEFDDEYKYRYYVSYINFKNNMIANPYDRSVYKIGYLGEYQKFINTTSKDSLNKAMGIWHHMLRRCYANDGSEKVRSYIGCSVDKQWHCFKNFAEWYLKNDYPLQSEKMCIDKDILIHGNKIYSADNCLLVPNRINSLFAKSGIIRGNLPIGVSYYWYDNSKYLASMKIGDKKHYQIGIFDNVTNAFYAYKQAKEAYIKVVADLYKHIVPEKVYNALYNYEVLITD